MNRRGFFIEAVRVAETWLPTIIPQSTESQRVGDQIDAAMIFARAHFVNVCRAVHSFDDFPSRVGAALRLIDGGLRQKSALSSLSHSAQRQRDQAYRDANRHFRFDR